MGTPADDAVISRAFQISVLVIVTVALCIFAAVWFIYWPLPDPVNRVTETKAAKVRTASTVTIPAIAFSDANRETGISFVHQSGAVGEKLLPESMGGGCAFFDYNNDGHSDILFVNSDFWPGTQPANRQRPTMALYKNDGHGNYADVTDETGLDVSFYGQGCAVGDYDNDGWVDLFFSVVGRNRLFHNNQGRFEDVTDVAGVAGSETEWSTGCGFFDYDNDGDLDLFVANYVRWSPEIDRVLDCTLTGGEPAYCPVGPFEGTFPYLYRNDGKGKFTDVSEAAGVQVKNSDTGHPAAKSLGVAPADLDGDGWIDLVVANDTVQNFLFHNRRDGTFEEIGILCGIGVDNSGNARGAMGIDIADFRNDGSLGVVIGNFANEMSALYCAAPRSLQFTDDAVATGLGPPSRIWLKFGVFFFDADLDGRLDVLAANGHIENDIHKVQNSQKYAQPPQIYWNGGPDAPSEFVPLTKEQTGSDFVQPLVGRGAAYADIDGDGDLDVLVTSTGGSPRLLRNEQKLGHHWLRLKLVGKKCNRDAIGAWVQLETTDGAVHRRQVMPTRSYLSQCELPVTFGLGSQKTLEKVRILWPDGSTQDLTDVAADQLLTVEQAVP
ncbi:MAG: CRTAC1 family protein [Planctomycetaceae bacterium]|nr:CRTAC1 family protein [Planctomycetaceae bacterium]